MFGNRHLPAVERYAPTVMRNRKALIKITGFPLMGPACSYHVYPSVSFIKLPGMEALSESSSCIVSLLKANRRLVMKFGLNDLFYGYCVHDMPDSTPKPGST
jgi:hypothetical protein